MPNPNFTHKMTLDEANAVNSALTSRIKELTAKLPDLTEDEKHELGHLTTVQNRDYGGPSRFRL